MPIHTPNSSINRSILYVIIVDRIDNLEITLLSQDGQPLDFTNGGQYEAEGWNITFDVSEYDSKALL